MTYEEAVEEFGSTDGALLAEWSDWADQQATLEEEMDDAEPTDTVAE